MATYIRVKSKVTGHEFDLLESQFDESRYLRVARYEPTTRPRRFKPNVRKGGAAKMPSVEKSDDQSA